MRYIIRPRHINTTPKILKEALGAERCVPYGANYLSNRWVPDWRSDLFLVYPPGALVGNADESYRSIRNFSQSTKAAQRQLLAEAGCSIPGKPVPGRRHNDGGASQCIVRPLRHFGGRGWRLTSDPDDYDADKEYIQELYPKTHEYRILFVFGTPLITLYKKVPEGTPQDQPWNHATCGARFITVNDHENNRLRHFDIYDRLAAVDVIKHAHIVAADVMYANKNTGCVVSELNFCPSITIPTNVTKVAQHVHQVLGQRSHR